jgi:hypothetical protein
LKEEEEDEEEKEERGINDNNERLLNHLNMFSFNYFSIHV